MNKAMGLPPPSAQQPGERKQPQQQQQQKKQKDEPAALSATKKQYSLSERRNIFDGDEFDVWAGRDVGLDDETAFIGKKYVNLLPRNKPETQNYATC